MNRLGIIALLSALSSVAKAGLLVTDVAGKAQVDGKAQVMMLSELPDGSSLFLAAGAQLVAVDLASGREYLLKGAGRFAIEKTGLRGLKGAVVEVRPLPADNLPDIRIAGGKVSQATLVMRSIPRMNDT